MNSFLRAVGLALLASWMGCADFSAAEQAFCARNPERCGEALQARVLLPSVSATCVRFEVRDPSSDQVLETRWLTRTGDDLKVVIARANLPESVKLAARPFRDGECPGGQEARTPNGPYETVTATFDKEKVVQVELRLRPGTDADGDGYVAITSGGADCDDAQAQVSPGVVEQCFDQADLNCDGRKGCEASTCGTNACMGAATSLALTLPPGSVQAGSCTSATVQVKDVNGGDTRVTEVTVVSLSADPAGGAAFYADAGCTLPATSVTLGSGESSATFHFQGQIAGSVTILATATGLTQDSKVAQIIPGSGNRLVFTSPARTVTAGACSEAVQFQSLDVQGSPAPVTATTAVALAASPGTAFRFYSDASCGSEVTSVNLAAGDSSGSFYFRSTQSGTVSVTVTASGFTGISQNETINPGPPTVLAFSQPSLTTAAGACAQFTLLVQDTFGNASPVSANQAITFSVNPSTGLTLSANADCSLPGTQFSINSGQSSRVLYARGTAVGSVTVAASRTGFATATLTVTVSPGAPDKLTFQTAPQTVVAGNCSSITTVQVRDSFDNPTPVTASTRIDLSSNSSGGMAFYLDAACNTSVTSVTVPAGQNSVSFYFRGSNAETVTISASSTSLTTATQTETINPQPPTELAFTTPAQTVQAGACSGIVIVETRAAGTPTTVSTPTTVTFNSTPSGFTFYSNSNCTTPISQTVIAAGQATALFYFRSNTAGAFTLGASSTGLTSATQSATITSPPIKLLLTTPAHMTAAGACSSRVTVQSADGSNNPAPVSTSTTVTLANTGTPTDPQFRFYSDASCTTAVSSVSIPAGQSTANLYYRGERARSITLTAAATGLTNVAQDHTITAGALANLSFSASTPAQTLLIGACSAVRQVESQDAFGNLKDTGNDLAVTLSGSAVAEFFSDASCTTPIGGVTIASGTHSASFYFKPTTGALNATAPLALSAAATGLPSATQVQTILPTVRTGSCIMSDSRSTCPIEPALLDMNKAFLAFQATSTNARSDQANTRCFLSSPSHVTCERYNSGGGNVNIRWSVAEFPSGVRVQHQTVDCANNATPVSLSAVAMNQTFLLLSSHRDGTSQGDTVPRLAVLTTPTQAEIRKTGGCTAGDRNHLQAVEYAGASVQRGLTSLSSGNTSAQVNLTTPVAPGRSILLYSYISDGSGVRICDRALRGALIDNGTRVSFSRGDGDTTNCTGSSFTAISWEVIQFPAGTVVQQVTQPFAGGLGSLSSEISPVDLSRALVIGGGQWASGQLHGEGRHSSSELISEMRAQAYLSDSTILSFYRETTNNTATFTAYVIQFDP